MTQQDTQPPAETLAPCPLCGRPPKRNGRGGTGGVLCAGDNATVGMIHRFQTYGADQAEAEAAWNAAALTRRAGGRPRNARDDAAVYGLGVEVDGIAVHPSRVKIHRRAGGDAIPAGMKPWHGGIFPPEDWDGGKVLLADGGYEGADTLYQDSHDTGSNQWHHRRPGGIGCDIIAYTPKPPAGGDAIVECIETQPIAWPFDDTETPPIWRVRVGEYCADFDFEQAARNFAGAINAGGDAIPNSLSRSSEDTRAMALLLAEVELHLKSSRIFITTREKMHPCGVDLHDELLARVTAAIDNIGKPNSHD